KVSWIRGRDWYVLTSGDSLYTHDDRFLVLHEAGSQDWTLHIKRAEKSDSGTYECQVSTGTGTISFFVQLDVVIPTAHIPGNGRTHVYRGSPFTIFCYIVKVFRIKFGRYLLSIILISL
ncbi:UNVERIFIED_CONTAM: hypothetical protein GTU68_053316, partial [Idotea baltica]|nr:hypothetical protein [Idotea baltica]